MGSPFQQQSLRRKILYIAIIVVLSFATYLVRQSEAFGIDAQARALELREQDRGEVGLTGSALRLTLLGSRGLVVCSLWVAATERQKKHEWNELELIVDSLTKLQPHFITPWLFQSWNLAYNVSVESDRIRDKYFYMTRGIQLLAEGERQNKNNPDLRFSMGFYNQHKIGLGDEANTVRSLFQMSCIDPLERDPGPNPKNPKALRKEDSSGAVTIDLKEFERFCKRYPMLVRRLRDSLRCETPRDIVDFLADNQKIPCRYEEKRSGTDHDIEQSPLKAPEEQFPLLPPLDPQDERADPEAIGFDNFITARDWYTYAVKPVFGGRKPRYMAEKIFLGYPARGQAYVAEYLEKEGWFDQEGWRIRGWFPNDKFTNGQDAVVGDTENWAVRAWSKAHEMYKKHGKADGLHLEPEEMQILDERAKRYEQKYGVPPRTRPLELTPEDQRDPDMVASFKAHDTLFWYEHYRNMTNFPHFYFVSQVEQDPKAVKARKDFFAAEQLRKAGDRELALETYRKAAPEWRDLLLAHKEFRRDGNVQEDTYEVQLKYLGLVREIMGKELQQVYFAQYCLGQALAGVPAPIPYPAFSLARDMEIPLVGPFDGADEEGVALIQDDARDRVRNRLSLPPLQSPQPPATPTPG
ncbi:MAG TPA: hypothetical protein VKU02_14925 [Gemmataceae bacterium]|nr:hypothetical protein [Gemmataceae bacterium]